MQTKFKYIYFIKETVSGKDFWECRNNKSDGLLATIEYYSPWRRWIVSFKADAVFNESCIQDIAFFLKSIEHMKSAASLNHD